MKRFMLRKHRSDNAFYIFNFVIGRDYNNTIIHFSTNFTAKVTFLCHLLLIKIIIKRMMEKLLILQRYDRNYTSSKNN